MKSSKHLVRDNVATSIENPVINSPFVEPSAALQGRRRPGHRRDRAAPPPVASSSSRSRSPRRRSRPARRCQFGGATRQQPNEIVNEIRQAVARWRLQGYPHITATTRELLAHWRAEDRERRLFFCQIEAAETAIYLTEAAEKTGRHQGAQRRSATRTLDLNDGLPRLAFKMATGLRQDRRHGDAHRLAGAQQARQPLGQAVQRPLPDRHARDHDPRSAPRAATRTTRRPSTARWTSSRRSSSTASRRRRSRSPTSTPSSAARRSQAAAPDQEDPRRRDADDERFKETPGRDGPPRLPRLRQRQEHRRPQRRGAPLLHAGAEGGGRRKAALDADERAEAKQERRGGPRLVRRAPGRPRQARHPRRLRPLGDARSSSRARATPRARSSRGSSATSG